MTFELAHHRLHSPKVHAQKLVSYTSGIEFGANAPNLSSSVLPYQCCTKNNQCEITDQSDYRTCSHKQGIPTKVSETNQCVEGNPRVYFIFFFIPGNVRVDIRRERDNHKKNQKLDFVSNDSSY